MNALYDYVRFDDLDLDSRSQCVGKGKNNQGCMLSAMKQAISIKLTTMVGHFFKRDFDRDFANVYMACLPC